jgi:hypothetical protein
MKHIVLMLLILLTISGCSFGIILKEPDWDPPVLSDQGCPNLEGKYLGLGIFNEFNRFRSINPKEDFVESIFFKRVTTTHFYPGYFKTLISVENGFPAIYKTGDNGKKYAKLILNLNDSRVGCHDGSLVIRVISGNKFANPIAMASETKFRKLPNGDVEVIRNTLGWNGHAMYKAPEVTERWIYGAAP